MINRKANQLSRNGKLFWRCLWRFLAFWRSACSSVPSWRFLAFLGVLALPGGVWFPCGACCLWRVLWRSAGFWSRGAIDDRLRGLRAFLGVLGAF